MYLEWMNEGMKHDTHVLPLERSQRTVITEFVGKQAIIRLKDKLPCLDQSAFSVCHLNKNGDVLESLTTLPVS